MSSVLIVISTKGHRWRLWARSYLVWLLLLVRKVRGEDCGLGHV